MTGDMTHIWMNDNRTHVYITKKDFYKKKNQLWHMWMEPSHIYRWMTNEPTHGYTACFFFVEKGKWVMAHMNFESWHAYRWMTNVQATAQERRWCVTPMCHTHKKNWVMSHVWASHGTHMNEWQKRRFSIPVIVPSPGKMPVWHTYLLLLKKISHDTRMKRVVAHTWMNDPHRFSVLVIVPSSGKKLVWHTYPLLHK